MKRILITAVMIVGTLLAHASVMDGSWIGQGEGKTIRRVTIHGRSVSVEMRSGAVQRLDGVWVSGALVVYRPLPGGSGSLMIFKRVDHRRIRLESRRVYRSGRLGGVSYRTFRRAGRLRPYLGEWRLREHLPGLPVRVRILSRAGRPYLEVWESVPGGERLVIRATGYWQGNALKIRWRGRGGVWRTAMMEGVDRDIRGKYRRLRVTVLHGERGRKRVYHLRRSPGGAGCRI